MTRREENLTEDDKNLIYRSINSSLLQYHQT